MVTRTTPDWDALAVYWHCFELHGFNKTLLSSMLASLIPPVLYVGGGRGSYVAHLQKYFGRDKVLVVDSAAAMARRARADFGLEYVLADVRRLPFPANVFASVVCVTGVVEFLKPTERKTALEEMARVCDKGGPILVTASAIPGQEGKQQRDAEAEAEYGTDTHQLLDIWFYRYDMLSYLERRMVSAFNAVAREMGDRAAAYHLLHESLPRYDRYIIFERFPVTVSAAGLLINSMQFLPEQGIGVWHLTSMS
jgi:ubiquinone/menaquinone biosynthesis C-methylase UbiE